jgi:hypothetical protein
MDTRAVMQSLSGCDSVAWISLIGVAPRASEYPIVGLSVRTPQAFVRTSPAPHESVTVEVREDEIHPLPSEEVFVSLAAVEVVVLGSAAKRLNRSRESRSDGVLPLTAESLVSPVSRMDDVASPSPQEIISAGVSRDAIVPSSTADHIGAGRPCEVIVRLGPLDRAGSGCPDSLSGEDPERKEKETGKSRDPTHP